MRKKNGCIRKRSDGCWEASFYVEHERKYIFGKSYKEVRKLVTSVMHEIDEVIYLEQTDLSVGDWMKQWLDVYVDIKPSTRIRYERDLRLYINPSLGNLKLKELSPIHIQRLYRKCINDGLSPKSVRNIHGIIHEALHKAVKMELLKRNVSDMCDLPKVRRQEMYPLSEEQVSRLLHVARDDEFCDEITVAIFTGLRESEIVGLTWDCIDFSRGTIRVYRQYVRMSSSEGKTLCEFTTCKNDRERIIEPANSVMTLLKRVYDQQKLKRLRAGMDWKSDPAFVFTKADGSPIQYQTMYKHFKKLVTQIGAPNTRFHDLRHTYATLALQHGIDIKTVSATLGHATVAFTLDKYGHVSDQMRHNAAQKMELLARQFV